MSSHAVHSTPIRPPQIVTPNAPVKRRIIHQRCMTNCRRNLFTETRGLRVFTNFFNVDCLKAKRFICLGAKNKELADVVRGVI